MMKNILLYLIFIISLLSCQESIRIKKHLKSPKIKYNSTYHLSLDNNLNIKVFDTQYNDYLHTHIFKDSLFYGVNREANNIIDIYNLKLNCQSDRITVNQDSINSEFVSSINVVSPDSIFFISSETLNLYLINSEGQIIKKWGKGKAYKISKDYELLYKLHFGLPTYSPFFRINIRNNKIHAPIMFMGIDDLPQLSIIKRIRVFDLNNNIGDHFYGELYGIMKEKGELIYPYDTHFPYLLVQENISYISYPLDHYVYMFDNETGKYLKKIPMSSKYIDKLQYPFKSNIGDQELWYKRIQMAFYGPLFYHEKINMYSRVVHHKQPLIDSAGNINDGTQRRSSIIILDGNFNIVGEKKFENGQLGVNSYLPLSNGILVGPQIEENSKILKFNKIYKINNKDEN